ncbi:putative inactive purple acid phosphatase 16 [Bienertia sinuspersici]
MRMRMEGQNENLSYKLHVLIALISFAIASLVVGNNNTKIGKNIKVKKGIPLKIAVFADLHFGENAWTNWGPLQDVHSIKLMSSILDHHKPEAYRACYYMKIRNVNADFVIYLGDVITADNIPIANASLYWDQALSPTKDRRIPWATVFGNHDDAHFVWPHEWFSATGIPPLNCSSVASLSSGENDCGFKGTTRLQLMDRDISTNNTLSFSQKGPEKLWPSVSNYVLKISSSDDSDTPVAYLYFLDSGGGSYPEVISTTQVKWFNTTSQEINPDSRAYETVAPSGEINGPCVGSINKERVAPQEAEHGIMQALEARPLVQVFMHD